MENSVAPKKGSALAVVLLVASILMMLTGVVGGKAMTHMRGVSGVTWNKQARHAAYGGLQCALSCLSNAPMANGSSYWQTMPQDPNLQFQFNIYNNSLGTSAVTAPDGTVVPAGKVYIMSQGWAADGAGRGSASMMNSLAEPSSAKFEQASLTDAQTALTGAVVDAYDSAAAPYSTYFIPGNASTYLKKAPVISNLATAGAVSLSASQVDGDIKVGPGATLATAYSSSGGSFASGTQSASSAPKNIPSYKVPATLASAASLGNLNVVSSQAVAPGVYDKLTGNGATITLAGGGVYYFKNGLDLSNCQIVIDFSTGADVVVYSSGNVDVHANTQINNGSAGHAKNLQLYFTGAAGQQKLRVDSNSKVCLVSGGDKLSTSISSGAEIFGALIGRDVNLNSAMIHFDTSLPTATMSGLTMWTLLGVQTDTGGSFSTAQQSVPQPTIPNWPLPPAVLKIIDQKRLSIF